MEISLTIKLDEPRAGGASALDVLERRAVEATLAACGGNVSATARRLGIERSSLQRKLRRWR